MSNESLDTLRTALLIFSVVILVAVLYKRLLIVLGKNKNKPKYVLVDDHQLDREKKQLVLPINLPRMEMVKVELFSVDGSHLKTLLEEKLAIGPQQLQFDVGNLETGRYYFSLTTHNHNVMQYFEIL